MCGRFANGLSAHELYHIVDDVLADESLTAHDNAFEYHPTYNVAPGSMYPVVHATDSKQGASVMLETMKWGVRRDADARGVLQINARDDTILRRPWPCHTKRCLVFCQGFFEWRVLPGPGRSKRIAHFVGLSEPGRGRPTAEGSSRQLMPMAGLYTEDRGQRAFTIVTTAANAQLRFLHDRMPVILATEQLMCQWLYATDTQPLTSLLRPYAGHLDCYAVPPEVGPVGYSCRALIEPVASRRDGIEAFLGKRTTPTQPKRSDAPVQRRVKRPAASPAPTPKKARGTPSLEDFWN
ncbi:hypothetical protein MNAN1_000778 [Malassezia nana]|uniref:Abasic site processing protein n=1 Tax=Malassezia nana TaxID=180528 RepID=A0AAF0EG57_9BASI|nr:hypothetical protein MNAN1_000778 [Malassezia nana]